MKQFINKHEAVFVGALIATSVPIFEALAALDPDKISDVKAWALGVFAASVRQLAIYLVRTIRPK